VGSIGVTGSYFEDIGHNTKEGYTYREFTSGEYKDVGNPSRALNAEEKAYVQSSVDDLFALFKGAVKEYRGLTDEEIAQISDAKYYIAKKALDKKLIDEIGGIAEVKKYLAGRLSMKPEDLLLCEPEVINAGSSQVTTLGGVQ
jgi:protease-4